MIIYYYILFLSTCLNNEISEKINILNIFCGGNLALSIKYISGEIKYIHVQISQQFTPNPYTCITISSYQYK